MLARKMRQHEKKKGKTFSKNQQKNKKKNSYCFYLQSNSSKHKVSSWKTLASVTGQFQIQTNTTRATYHILTWEYTIKKVVELEKKKYDKCSPCKWNSGKLCCKQVISTTRMTKHEFNIFRSISCKNKWIIYLLECNVYKTQCSGKRQGQF